MCPRNGSWQVFHILLLVVLYKLSQFLFPEYLFIVGGFHSDNSDSTFGIQETEIVDILSDISNGCGLKQSYAKNIHPFEIGGDMLGDNPVVCGGYCRLEDCGNGKLIQKALC